MKETGIIMSGDHPKLILDGKKTMTRRVITPQPVYIEKAGGFDIGMWIWIRGKYWHKTFGQAEWKEAETPSKRMLDYCPYGQVGDRLWVRETWDDETGIVLYKVDCNEREAKDYVFGWKSPIFMPRWASRITLEITKLRVERVQEITEENALAEGITIMQGTWQAMGRSETGRPILVGQPQPYTARYHYEALWDSLNAKRGYGWEANPWVWVIGFRRIE